MEGSSVADEADMIRPMPKALWDVRTFANHCMHPGKVSLKPGEMLFYSSKGGYIVSESGLHRECPLPVCGCVNSCSYAMWAGGWVYCPYLEHSGGVW